MREALKAQCLSVDANAHCDNPMADLQLVSDDLGELQRQAAEFTPNKDKAAIGENILGLRLLCLYGLKGAAAYMEHAHVLGQIRQRHLRPVPQNHGLAGHLAC
ncbi:Hydroxylamine reductase [Salmonella enterica subsp. enterica]|nr:Hydroxylamine reductase [Salmonella enterica subsp. enterica]